MLNKDIRHFLVSTEEVVTQMFIEVEGYNWFKGEKYLVGIPLANVVNVVVTAHYDTFCKIDDDTDNNLLYDAQKEIFFGHCNGDDRAGCWILYKHITTHAKKPYVVLCDLEESGCQGARQFIKDYVTNKETFSWPDFMNTAQYYVALDREGYNDAVYYTTDNKKFKTFVETFGFKEASGSCSDIKQFETEYKKCGVNLSIGYSDQHSKKEWLRVSYMRETLTKLGYMLAADCETFEYIEDTTPYSYKYGYGNGEGTFLENYKFDYTEQCYVPRANAGNKALDLVDCAFLKVYVEKSDYVHCCECYETIVGLSYYDSASGYSYCEACAVYYDVDLAEEQTNLQDDLAEKEVREKEEAEAAADIQRKRAEDAWNWEPLIEKRRKDG